MRSFGRLCAAVAAGGLVLPGAALASGFAGQNGRIAYTLQGAVCTADADGSHGLQVTSPPPRADDGDPRFSADGRLIAFVRSDVTSPGPWVVHADGSTATDLSPTFTLPGGTFAQDPSFSATGSRILFAVTDRTGSSLGIDAINTSGGGLSSLTTGDDSLPTASADGTKIAFLRELPDHSFQVMVSGADGSNPQVVYTSDPAIFPNYPGPVAFSPDSLKLAFREGRDIVVRSSSPGGSLTKLTNNTPASGGDEAPAFSPDGTRIATLHFTTPDPGGDYPITTSINLLNATVAGQTSAAIITAPPSGYVGIPDWGVKPASGMAPGAGSCLPPFRPRPVPQRPIMPPVVPPVIASNAFTLASAHADRRGNIALKLQAPGSGNFEAHATTRFRAKKADEGSIRRKREQATAITYGAGSAAASRPGKVTLTIRPSKAARKLLRQGKRLNVLVSVSFTPTGGKASTKATTVKVRSKRTKRR